MMMSQPEDIPGRRPMWPIAVIVVVALVALVAWIMLRSPPLAGETLYDAGPIRIESSPFLVHHEFTLTNVSGSTITIEAARATCGCTEFIHPDSIIEPGEVIVIPVSLELTMSGRKKGGVVLMLDDGSRVNLVMAATVERAFPLAVSPDPLDLTARRVIPYMDLEWSGGGRPPLPVFETTEGLIVEGAPWRNKAKASSSNGRPAIWTSKLRVETPATAGPGSVTIRVGDLQPTTVEVIWTTLPSNESPEVSGPVAPAASPSATADTEPVEAPAG